jgi:HTH-type transcriptional regulator/antitoxin MqsA
MECPNCEKVEMIEKTMDIPYTYKGSSTVIKQARGKHCPRCDEFILSDTEARRVSEAMLAFNKQVNAESVDPAFISDVRKKLKLDQKEAAAIFGGGVNAFSRYESGKAVPPVALIKLFKILNTHPDLLAMVR